MHGRLCGGWLVEIALQIRNATRPDEIARAVAIDKAVLGSSERAGYITSVAASGGLSVAVLGEEIQSFSCLDHDYFFGKPFVSLLIVSPDARRHGLGAALLSHNAGAYREVWTSTNQSNEPMRKLLDKAGWRYCGVLDGLDEGDPERFYRTG